MSKSRSSIAVTMPKLPPPPRTAQNRSGLVVLVGADLGAVAEHELDGGDAVGGHAELPGVPPDAAAERVADDADVGGGAVQGGEAVRGRRLDDVLPEHAGARPGRSGAPRRRGRRSSPRSAAGRCPGAGRAARRCGRCPAGRPGARAPSAARTTSLTSSASTGKATAAGRWSTATFHGIRARVVPGVAGQLDTDGGVAPEGVGAAGGRGGLDGHGCLLVEILDADAGPEEPTVPEADTPRLGILPRAGRVVRLRPVGAGGSPALVQSIDSRLSPAKLPQPRKVP